MVLSYQRQLREGVEQPYLFRTYKNLHRGADKGERLLDRNPGLAQDIPIYQVARATSAAPGYFKPPKTNDLEYLDGGFGTNNPSIEIYDEVRKMNNNSESCIHIIVSIGTGGNTELARFSNHRGVLRYLHYITFAKRYVSESQSAHIGMLRMRQRSTHKFHYYRLNVTEGLAAMKLDEWKARGAARVKLGQWVGRLRSSKPLATEAKERCRDNGMPENEKIMADPPESHPHIPTWLQPRNKTLDEITRCTENYLRRPDVQEMIEQCAQILVDGRRGRARKDPQRWEKACFGAWYQCNVDRCPRAEKEYENREALRRHLKDKHQFSICDAAGREALDKALDACKIVVR